MQFKITPTEHPDKAALLAWSEGELAWWRSWRVGRHVRSCWQCRGQISELETLICAVSRSIDQSPEPSRVDTSKAYWRFRQACLELDEAPQARSVRLKPAWAVAASVILATAGLAYVTNWPRFQRDAEKPLSIPARSQGSRASTPSFVPPTVNVLPVAPSPSSLPKGERTPELTLGPTEDDLLSTEIQALAALHRSRFCLNSGITVRRVASAVEITGLVQSGDQRDRIIGILSGVGPASIMRVRLSQPAGSPDVIPSTKDVQPGAAPEGTPLAPPLIAWLRQNLGVGSRLTQRDMFNVMNSMVLESERVSSEAWALRHMAEQFPLRRTRQLRPELSDQLLQIVDDHTIALANDLRQLQSLFDLVLGTQPAQSGTLPALLPDVPWQDKVITLQEGVEDVVSQLLASFSADATPPPSANAAPSPDFSALFHSINGQTRNCIAVAGDLRADIQIRSAESHRGQGPNAHR